MVASTPLEPVRPVVVASAPLAAPAVPAPQWASDQLLKGGREALIEHQGSVYRLRLTASGKLILTK